MEPAPFEVLYGFNSIYSALYMKRRNHLELYVRDTQLKEPNQKLRKLLSLAKKRNVRVRPLKKAQLLSITGDQQNQGVALKTSMLQPTDISNTSIKELKKQRLVVMLDGIQDPHNFGAIVRSCHFFGVHTIIIPSTGSSPLSPAAHRASAGALEAMKVFQTPSSLSQWLAEQQHHHHQSKSLNAQDKHEGQEAYLHAYLQSAHQHEDNDMHIIGTAIEDEAKRPHHRYLKHATKFNEELTEANFYALADFCMELEQNPYHAASSRLYVLILGNEGKGMSSSLLPLCQTLIHIPSSPAPFLFQDDKQEEREQKDIPLMVDSLNVSVSTGIALYELSSRIL